MRKILLLLLITMPLVAWAQDAAGYQGIQAAIASPNYNYIPQLRPIPKNEQPQDDRLFKEQVPRPDPNKIKCVCGDEVTFIDGLLSGMTINEKIFTMGEFDFKDIRITVVYRYISSHNRACSIWEKNENGNRQINEDNESHEIIKIDSHFEQVSIGNGNLFIVRDKIYLVALITSEGCRFYFDDYPFN